MGDLGRATLAAPVLALIFVVIVAVDTAALLSFGEYAMGVR